MALHDYMDGVLGSKASLRVLRTLVRYEGKVFTVRELARTSALSHPEVSLVVKNLERRGMVKLQPVGRAYQVILNEENYVLKSIVEPMIGAEKNTLNSLVSTIRPFFKKAGVTSAVIYGSVAKGVEKETSDVDVLIVADNIETARDCAARASAAALAKFGVGLSPLVIGRTRFIRRQNENFEKSVMESYILVWGKDLKELVGSVKIGQ